MKKKILLNVVQAGIVTAFVTMPITSCGKQPDEPPVEEHNITFDGSKEFECQNGGKITITFNTNGTIQSITNVKLVDENNASDNDLSDLIINSFDLQDNKITVKIKSDVIGSQKKEINFGLEFEYKKTDGKDVKETINGFKLTSNPIVNETYYPVCLNTSSAVLDNVFAKEKEEFVTTIKSNTSLESEPIKYILVGDKKLDNTQYSISDVGDKSLTLTIFENIIDDQVSIHLNGKEVSVSVYFDQEVADCFYFTKKIRANETANFNLTWKITKYHDQYNSIIESCSIYVGDNPLSDDHYTYDNSGYDAINVLIAGDYVTSDIKVVFSLKQGTTTIVPVSIAEDSKKYIQMAWSSNIYSPDYICLGNDWYCNIISTGLKLSKDNLSIKCGGDELKDDVDINVWSNGFHVMMWGDTTLDLTGSVEISVTPPTIQNEKEISIDDNASLTDYFINTTAYVDASDGFTANFLTKSGLPPNVMDEGCHIVLSNEDETEVPCTISGDPSSGYFSINVDKDDLSSIKSNLKVKYTIKKELKVIVDADDLLEEPDIYPVFKIYDHTPLVNPIDIYLPWVSDIKNLKIKIGGQDITQYCECEFKHSGTNYIRISKINEQYLTDDIHVSFDYTCSPHRDVLWDFQDLPIHIDNQIQHLKVDDDYSMISLLKNGDSTFGHDFYAEIYKTSDLTPITMTDFTVDDGLSSDFAYFKIAFDHSQLQDDDDITVKLHAADKPISIKLLQDDRITFETNFWKPYIYPGKSFYFQLPFDATEEQLNDLSINLNDKVLTKDEDYQIEYHSDTYTLVKFPAKTTMTCLDGGTIIVDFPHHIKDKFVSCYLDIDQKYKDNFSLSSDIVNKENEIYMTINLNGISTSLIESIKIIKKDGTELPEDKYFIDYRVRWIELTIQQGEIVDDFTIKINVKSSALPIQICGNHIGFSDYDPQHYVDIDEEKPTISISNSSSVPFAVFSKTRHFIQGIDYKYTSNPYTLFGDQIEFITELTQEDGEIIIQEIATDVVSLTTSSTEVSLTSNYAHKFNDTEITAIINPSFGKTFNHLLEWGITIDGEYISQSESGIYMYIDEDDSSIAYFPIPGDYIYDDIEFSFVFI